MQIAKYISLIVLAVGLSCSSCEKDPETVPEGTVRLLINVNHHGFPIANAVVFRKNNTTENAGTDTSVYDARYVCDANGNLILTDVGNGHKTMFLYAKGLDATWDTLVMTPVSGYQFVNATGENKDFTITVPVSE